MYIFYAYTFDFLHNYTEYVKLSKKMKNNLQNKSGKPLLSTAKCDTFVHTARQTALRKC